jgi:carboxylesterase
MSETRAQEADRLSKGFFLEGTNGAVVLISHGFGSSPSEHVLTAKALNAAGYAVDAPLLAGHMVDEKEFDKIPWGAWYKTLEDEYFKLKEKYQKIYFAGLSMGGCLALRLAEYYPCAAVGVMAPALINKSKASNLAFLIAPFKKRLAFSTTFSGFPDNAEEYLRGYPDISVHAAAELNKLEKDTRKHLKNIVSPVIVFQSHADTMVDPKGAQYLMDHISSPIKKAVYFEKSGHCMSLDSDREAIFASMVAFFDERKK